MGVATTSVALQRTVKLERLRTWRTMAMHMQLSSDSENISERASAESSDLQLQPESTAREPVVSLLDRLQTPQRSELTRKHALRTNPSAAEGHCKKRPSCSTTRSL